jgi:uncharacterized RDD family membrane protein YckC
MRHRLADIRRHGLRRHLMPLLVLGLVVAVAVNVAFLAAGQPGPGEQLLRMPGWFVLAGVVSVMLICSSAYH